MTKGERQALVDEEIEKAKGIVKESGWFENCQICNAGLCSTIDRLKKETGQSLNNACRIMSLDSDQVYTWEWEASDLFRDLLKSGIKLVLSEDGKAFTYDGIIENPRDYNYCMDEFILSHRESKKKSQRLKETFKSKREKARNDNIKGTKLGPSWLKLSKDRKEFERIEDRCAIVQKIFEMYLGGKGVGVIAKELNQLDIWKPRGYKGRESSWSKSYVYKILKSRMVLGEYQPNKMVDDKKQPVGDPIKNYYPQVIDEGVFYAVQELMKSKSKKRLGGRTGKVSNLFTHLATCGYCGGSMHFINKGKPPKGNKYLVCENGKRGNDCKYISWKYDEFEKDIIHLLSFDLDLTALLPDHEKIRNEIQSLEIKRAGIEGQISKLEKEIRRGFEIIRGTDGKTKRRIMSMAMDDEVAKLDALTEELPAINKRITDLKSLNGSAEKRLNDTKRAFALVEKADEKTRIDLRFKLRQMLRSLIDEIKMYPNGSENQGKKFRMYEVQFKGANRSFARGFDPQTTPQEVSTLGII